jgi:hypothetical protein
VISCATTYNTCSKVTVNDNFGDFRSTTANLDKLQRGQSSAVQQDDDGLSKATLALYKSFMQSYVKRINDATFGVTIGGIRIGSAKYSRLAQINLKTRVITFSRFAIENVPERGRRYLVLHELAHVHEASHNQHFWNLVGLHEPDYKDIGLDLDRAFKKNVQSHDRAIKRGARANIIQDRHVVEQAINSARSENLLWTPDHGFIEQGSRRFGLHKDPVERFVKEGHSLADETFKAYVELKLEEFDRFENDYEIDSENSDSELNFAPSQNQSLTHGLNQSNNLCADQCDDQWANAAPAQSDDIYCFEEDTDSYFGTISGGDLD